MSAHELKEAVIESPGRRSFLQGMLSAGAFVICVTKSPLLARAAGNGASASDAVNFSLASPSVDSTAFHPGVYLGIQPDGQAFIVCHLTVMGHGVRTTPPRIVAD